MHTGQSNQIREHMDVVCSDGGKLGVVDRLEGDLIKLTRDDSPDGKHHTIPIALVSEVDDQVHLSLPGETVMRTWGTV
jgi:hypothetical protein